MAVDQGFHAGLGLRCVFVAHGAEPLGKQAVTVRGETVLAPAYRVTARQTELTVWDSEDGEWLGLESVARGGRIIRYELT